MTHDLLGMFDRFTPRFVKRYAELHQLMAGAFDNFREDVIRQKFPTQAHGVEMEEAEWAQLLESFDD